MLAFIVICITFLVALGLVVYLIMGHTLAFVIAFLAIVITVGVCVSVVLIVRIIKSKNKKE